jgi:hypothetical protein
MVALSTGAHAAALPPPDMTARTRTVNKSGTLRDGFIKDSSEVGVSRERIHARRVRVADYPAAHG